MKTYQEMLNEAYSKIKVIESSDRFEIPKVAGQIQGKKTVITNLGQIASYLRRDLQHLAKFLQKELATPGKLEKDFLMMNTKLSSGKVNEKVELYAKEFVICPECKKPDTEIVHEKGIKFKHCLACGAMSPIKK